jgi:hypothetical protein
MPPSSNLQENGIWRSTTKLGTWPEILRGTSADRQYRIGTDLFLCELGQFPTHSVITKRWEVIIRLCKAGLRMKRLTHRERLSSVSWTEWLVRESLAYNIGAILTFCV